MSSHRKVNGLFALGMGLLALPACGFSDILINAVGLPSNTAYLDVILWQDPGMMSHPETVKPPLIATSGQLKSDPPDSFTIGIDISEEARKHAYNIFVAAFSQSADGQACLVTSSTTSQEGGFAGIASLQVPFPPMPDYYPTNAALCVSTDAIRNGQPMIGAAELRIVRFAEGSNPNLTATLRLSGWNFRTDSQVLVNGFPVGTGPTSLLGMPVPDAANEIILPLTPEQLALADGRLIDLQVMSGTLSSGVFQTKLSLMP